MSISPCAPGRSAASPSSGACVCTTRAPPILVFSMHNDPFIVSRALKIGANGYILKDTPAEEIVEAFERVRDGTPYLSHELASEVAFMEARRRTTNPLGRSPCASCRFFRLLAEGKPYAQIAADLHVSYKTIANTCGQLKTKLGCARCRS